MKFLMIIAALAATPAVAQQALVDLETAKQACMSHGLKKPTVGRHPELSDAYPGGWEPGFESCEAVWKEWKGKADAAAAKAAAENATMQEQLKTRGPNREVVDDRAKRNKDDLDKIDRAVKRR